MSNLTPLERRTAREAFANACEISVDDILEWIKDNMLPDQVFDERDLKQWALDNGYVEEE